MIEPLFDEFPDRPDHAVDCPHCEDGRVEVEPSGDPARLEYWICDVCEGYGWVEPIPEEEATPLDLERFARWPWLIFSEEENQ